VSLVRQISEYWQNYSAVAFNISGKFVSAFIVRPRRIRRMKKIIFFAKIV
jgi:hypothetical protein